MNLGLDMSLKLQQKLSFQMIQSLKLLQVNTLQLEQLLKTELEMNPVLETTDELEEAQEQEPEKEETEEDKELEVGEDEIDWEEYLEDGFDLTENASRETERETDHYEPTAVYQATLEEHLNNQLAEKSIPEKIRLLVQFLIGCLDNDGYLRIPLDQIAEETQTSIYDLEEALNVIWSMEPPGLGARTLQECLVLQLRRQKMFDSLAMRIVVETWDLFEKLKVPEIARTFGVEVRDVQAALDVIKRMHPKPGYLVSPERSSTIIPDLIVEKVDGDFVVSLNDRSVPSLRISRAYANMLKRGSKVKKDVKKYVREKFNGATWLIRSIEQRKSTMLRVMYAIIDKQRDFFEKGPPNLNPLRLQDIADIVDMHISTVSRVTSNKYVQTQHGIYELKYFFTEAVGQDADGADISSERIRNRIRELVEGENPKKPLSDQKIADILSREDLKVARRTVAKYREQLKLLPARLRQKYDQ
ncbi:MAG: RNA polymerase factor sigma-54 [Chitinivibrionales bacterium]|nr:RNA polymerase factor sigma-54 [Chitinivibrionales bacterium]MBD3395901.1 RNA polymerase factor sigma-54 [Chitinivibrionales bacterium]